MKASLEVEETEYRGVILESETPEEKAVLERIWTNQGRPVMIDRLMGGMVKVAIAPTPRAEDIPYTAIR